MFIVKNAWLSSTFFVCKAVIPIMKFLKPPSYCPMICSPHSPCSVIGRCWGSIATEFELVQGKLTKVFIFFVKLVHTPEDLLLPPPQGASPVRTYSVQYYSSEGGSWRTAVQDLHVPEYTLTGLDPHASYGVVVRACNAHGASEPSGIAEVGGQGQWAVQRTREAEKLQQVVLFLKEATTTSSVAGPAAASILWQVRGRREVLWVLLK
ncbi:Fibronectin type III [Trinorchestia longiramus]|nr:Fibronectin type III [Trinorchestia longiramus]